MYSSIKLDDDQLMGLKNDFRDLTPASHPILKLSEINQNNRSGFTEISSIIFKELKILR